MGHQRQHVFLYQRFFIRTLPESESRLLHFLCLSSRGRVAQGSVLSPTLFDVAISGLLGQVPVGVHGLAFADDYAVICSKSSAVEACHRSRLPSMLQHHGPVLEGSNFLRKKLRLYDFAG